MENRCIHVNSCDYKPQNAAVGRMEIQANRILIKDYDYNLPQNRIAEFPLDQRDGSKLLVYEHGAIKDSTFYHLPEHIPSGSTLILNNTRVIEARVLFRKSTGGVIEIFCLEPHGQTVEDSLSSSGKVQWHCLI